jgi:hypothetical protein
LVAVNSGVQPYSRRLIDVSARFEQQAADSISPSRAARQRGQAAAALPTSPRRRPGRLCFLSSGSRSGIRLCARSLGAAAAASTSATALSAPAGRRLCRGTSLSSRSLTCRCRRSSGGSACCGLVAARGGTRGGIQTAGRSKPALHSFERQLLLVGPTGCRSSGPASNRSFHSLRVLTGHVIARQTGAGRLRAVIGSAVEQRLHRRGVLLFDRPHQCRGAARGFLRIHFRPGSDQHFDRLGLAVSRGEHQRGLTVRSALFDVGAGFHQLVDHRHIAVKAGHHQRCHTLAIRRVDLGAGANQQVGRLEVIAIDRPLQGGRTVDAGRVDVRFLLQQRPQGCFVSLHHGVGNVAAGAVEGGDPQQECRDTRNDQAALHGGLVSHLGILAVSFPCVRRCRILAGRSKDRPLHQSGIGNTSAGCRGRPSRRP